MEQTDLLEQEPEQQAPAFQLKGSMLTLTTLELLSNDLAALDSQLAEKAAQAPDFFRDAPLILALDKRQPGDLPDLAELLTLCRNHGLRPLAIRSEQEEELAAAAAIDLPVLPLSLARDRNLPAQPQPAAPKEPELLPARIINSPVRSGQQIYAKNADLIVTASVSAGAELLADGHIHVYGAMRGRALAGINGNTQARIFCQQLGAELVSIAGQYKIAEDLRRIPAWGNAAQIYLDGEQMHIIAL
ncbi:septum site-determining protein MinC [Thiopseudomonas denitrificans]|uniref:Probable septum site-determining protein MinC n=1 Tax=Thiopseudomonas denitrificans TaxID=1501432 RepID=A0A4R6TYA6_9GAMM|nr:septum site-determining protein MinC [Thiopseudomonas denitrificans]TDQ36895.1 septum site-determining protein MinC [Thiopseudomonas denitrificans]